MLGKRSTIASNVEHSTDNSDDSGSGNEIEPTAVEFNIFENIDFSYTDVNEVENQVSVDVEMDLLPNNLEDVPVKSNCVVPKKSSCLKSDLADWAVSCRVPHTTVKRLWKVLIRNGNTDIPRDPRTLLKTQRKNKNITLTYGVYQHYGIERRVRNVLDTYPYNPQSPLIKIAINIDDVPVNRLVSLTVITGSVENSSQVFLIGAFQPNQEEAKKIKKKGEKSQITMNS